MQSVIQKKSYGSVKVFWLNKELLKDRIKKAAEKLAKENSIVERVVLFGSVSQDRPTAFSDVDILIVVRHSDKRFIDRADDFISYFENIGMNVDLFVYTNKEAESGSDFLDKAISKGRCIFSRR